MRHKILKLLRNDGIWGIADQIVISAVNLTVSMLFIHLLSKGQYGLYGLGFAVMSYVLGIGNALVFTPMTVLYPAKSDTGRLEFRGGLFRASALLALSLIIVSVSGVWIAYVNSIISQQQMIFWIAVAVGSGLVLNRDFMRRYLYVLLKPRLAFTLDFIVAIIVVGGVAVVGFDLVGTEVKPFAAALYFILAGFSTFFVFFMISELRALAKRLPSQASATKSAFLESWEHGRWGLVGMTITFLQSQSYIFVLAAILDHEAIGEANAARMAIAPMFVVISGIMAFFLPKLAYWRAEHGDKAIIDRAKKMAYPLIAVVALYCLVVGAMADFFVFYALGEQYVGAESLVWLWLVFLLVQTIRIPQSLTLQALREFKILAQCNIIPSIVTIIASIVLTSYFGVLGGVTALLLGEILFSFILQQKLRLIISQQP